MFGSWMSDPINPHKLWLTRGYHGNMLEEYQSWPRFRSGLPTKKYNLKFNRFYGTQHAVYNGSFYYHFAGKPYIVRYDMSIPDVVAAGFIRNSHFNDTSYLYKYGQSYYDISADENGLWIIFSRTRDDDRNMNIMKLDLLSLTVVKVWQLPVDAGVHLNGFIGCGIVYLVKSSNAESMIDKTYDLYLDVLADALIPIGIPFKQNNFLTFFTNTSNRKSSALFGWDGGYLISYPILF